METVGGFGPVGFTPSGPVLGIGLRQRPVSCRSRCGLLNSRRKAKGPSNGDPLLLGGGGGSRNVIQQNL